ncbi:MAG: hypothetical protein PF549_01095 [Patescibacteria group bacterium]|jgi:hypothetical protein|nr:hypothetical protein [Patescibacteria group bacterium]
MRFYCHRHYLTDTCVGKNNVNNGVPKPPEPSTVPTCTGYDFTIDSGESQAAFVSTCGTCQVDRWSAVCEDFECSGFACEYKYPTYEQSYDETNTLTGTFGANNSYTNTSGSQKTRKCTYKVWNHDTPLLTGQCVGTVRVNSSDPAEPAGCIGYNFTINSGESQAVFVSATGADLWRAVCEDFSCSGYDCTYNSSTYTQSYNVPAGASFTSTFGANNGYTNTSGSMKVRKCNYTVWNSAAPTAPKGTCVGDVRVCEAGSTWNGVTCYSPCIPNSACTASILATMCPTSYCYNGCNFVAGTKDCSAPINGTCGSYNENTYYPDDTDWGSGAFCLSGAASPSSPSFPAIGSTTTWTCEGLNGGDPSEDCTASRDELPLDLTFLASNGVDKENNITVYPNEEVTLYWKPQSATSCFADSNPTLGIWEGAMSSADSPAGYQTTPFSYLPSEIGLKTFGLECSDGSNYIPLSVSVDVTPFQCQGTLPSNASPLNSEEETELSSGSISWTYDDNGIDDPLKCEFECNVSYSWDESTCVPGPIDGTCGSYNGNTYSPDDTDWGSGLFCFDGDPLPVDPPSFPTVGTTIEWTCSGQYGGDPSGTCSATRSVTPPSAPKSTNWQEVNP